MLQHPSQWRDTKHKTQPANTRTHTHAHAHQPLNDSNNLNKILLTPLSARDAWAIDACLLPSEAAAGGEGGGVQGGGAGGGGAGGGGGGGGTLFLDIVKAGADLKTWPGSDRMCYYGYKFEALCTGAVAAAAVWGRGCVCAGEKRQGSVGERAARSSYYWRMSLCHLFLTPINNPPLTTYGTPNAHKKATATTSTPRASLRRSCATASGATAC